MCPSGTCGATAIGAGTRTGSGEWGRKLRPGQDPPRPPPRLPPPPPPHIWDLNWGQNGGFKEPHRFWETPLVSRSPIDLGRKQRFREAPQTLGPDRWFQGLLRLLIGPFRTQSSLVASGQPRVPDWLVPPHPVPPSVPQTHKCSEKLFIPIIPCDTSGAAWRPGGVGYNLWVWVQFMGLGTAHGSGCNLWVWIQPMGPHKTYGSGYNLRVWIHLMGPGTTYGSGNNLWIWIQLMGLGTTYGSGYNLRVWMLLPGPHKCLRELPECIRGVPHVPVVPGDLRVAP